MSDNTTDPDQQPNPAAEKPSANAEPETKPPEDPVLAALHREVARAEARMKLAQHERDRLAARLPAIEASKIEGTVAVDDKVAIESEILAHTALGRLADQIAAKIRDVVDEGQIVLLHGPDSGAPLLSYRAFAAEALTIEALFQSIAPAAKARPAAVGLESVLASFGAAVPSIADLLSYLRVDESYSGRTFTIVDSVLASDVAARLGPPFEITYPQAFLGVREDGEDPVLGPLASVRSERNRAVERVARLPEAEKAAAAIRLAQAEAVHTGFETRITAVPEGGRSPLFTLYQGAATARVLAAGGSAIQIEIIRAGGTVRTRRWAFWSKLDHSGGAIATFRVFNDKGAIRTAGSFSHYEGFAVFGKGKRAPLPALPRTPAMNRALPPA